MGVGRQLFHADPRAWMAEGPQYRQHKGWGKPGFAATGGLNPFRGPGSDLHRCPVS
ncbi:uncharacterized protein BCN122_II2507 [Burkholderia cenocepacia]|nr:uncharacterized protein BCN122_II2507 [Burkholderia cenocepacia]